MKGQTRAKRPAYKRKGPLAPWLLLTPHLACVMVFVLLPFLDAVRRSFFSAMSGELVGLKNYRTVFMNSAFQRAAWNTLRFTAVCLPVLIVLSLLLAVLLAAFREQRGIFKTTFLLPMSIPVSSVVLLWNVLFHQNGLLSAFAVRLGGAPRDWMETGWAFTILVGSYLWKNTGYDMILWTSGISGIPLSLYEAAHVDGAGALQRFFYITLPNLVPTFFTVSVLSLLNSFKVFREAYLVAGDYPNPDIYLLQHLFNNWFLKLDVDKMCAAAVMMAAAVFAVILLLQFFFGSHARE